MKYFLSLLVAVLGMVSCTRSIDETHLAPITSAPESIDVSFEGSDTRISLNDGRTIWNRGDLVSVFYKSFENMKWMFQGETGDRSGSLDYISGNLGAQTMEEVMIIYPYNSNYRVNLTTRMVEATLPGVQSYAEDSYGKEGNIMTASSDYRNFVMRSVCGWLRIELTGTGQSVTNIVLRGNDGEQLAGDIYVNTADATAQLCSAVEDTPEDDSMLGGSLNFPSSVCDVVTLDCVGGVVLGDEPTHFYIALVPQLLAHGATAEINCSDGSTMTISTSEEVNIRRNHIVPVDAGDYKGVVPIVNELAYRTNNGEPLSVKVSQGFGGEFVSNNYNVSTGEGALRFSSPITEIPDEAFSGCTALTWIGIPESVIAIGDMAFKDCSSMEEITIPSSVSSIGTSSFEGCGGRATIYCKIQGASASSFGKFYKAAFTEVVIGEEVTSIGYAAFSGCSSLQHIELPSTMNNIAAIAFSGCSSLTTVTLPQSITKLGRRAFYGCSSLSEVRCYAVEPPKAVLDSNESQWQAFMKCAEGCTIYVPTEAHEAYISADGWEDYATQIKSL